MVPPLQQISAVLTLLSLASLSHAASTDRIWVSENKGSPRPISPPLSFFSSSTTIEGWRQQQQHRRWQEDAATSHLLTSTNTRSYDHTPTLTSLISTRPVRKYSAAAGEFRRQFRLRPEIRAIIIREDDHTNTIGQMEAIRDPAMKDDKEYNHNFHWAMKHYLQDKNASQELQRTWQSLSFKSKKRLTDDRAREKLRKANAATRRQEEEEEEEEEGTIRQNQQQDQEKQHGPQQQKSNDEQQRILPPHFNTASNRKCRRARKELQLVAPHMNRPLEENKPTGFTVDKEGRLMTPMEIVRWASVNLVSLYSSEKVLTATLKKFFEDNEESFDPLAVKLALGRRSLELKSKLNSFSSSSRRRLQRESMKDGNEEEDELQQIHQSDDAQGDVERSTEEKEDDAAKSEGDEDGSPHDHLHQGNKKQSSKALMTSGSHYYHDQTGITPNVSSLLHSIDWWRPPQVERE